MNKTELQEFALNNNTTLYYTEFKRKQQNKTYTITTADHQYLQIIEQVQQIEQKLKNKPYQNLIQQIEKQIDLLNLSWLCKYEISTLIKLLSFNRYGWFEVILNQNKKINNRDLKYSTLFNIGHYDYTNNETHLIPTLLDVVCVKLNRTHKKHEELQRLVQIAADTIVQLITETKQQITHKQITIKLGTDFHKLLHLNSDSHDCNLTDFNQFPIYETTIYYNNERVAGANIGLFSNKKQLYIDSLTTQYFDNSIMSAKAALCTIFMPKVGLEFDFTKFYSCYETLNTFKSSTPTSTSPRHGFYNNMPNCLNKSAVLLYAKKQSKPKNNRKHFVYVFDGVNE